MSCSVFEYYYVQYDFNFSHFFAKSAKKLDACRPSFIGCARCFCVFVPKVFTVMLTQNRYCGFAPGIKLVSLWAAFSGALGTKWDIVSARYCGPMAHRLAASWKCCFQCHVDWKGTIARPATAGRWLIRSRHVVSGTAPCWLKKGHSLGRLLPAGHCW